MTKNTPALFDVLRENWSNERCVLCFTSHLNYCLFFLWNCSCCQFGVTGITGDFPWKNFSFFQESHSSSSFQNLLSHLCPIYLSKMYCKRKKCPCLLCPINDFLSSQYICVAWCISISPAHFLLCFCILWLSENDSRSFRSVRVITWM